MHDGLSDLYDDDISSEDFMLSKLEIENLLKSPIPTSQLISECKDNEQPIQMPEFNPVINYYERYWDMYLQNEQLM